jgi:hypothetical protein
MNQIQVIPRCEVNEYVRARDAFYLGRLFVEPPAIVAACNRVQRRYERSMGQEWRNGIATGVAVVLVAGAAVVWVCML